MKQSSTLRKIFSFLTLVIVSVALFACSGDGHTHEWSVEETVGVTCDTAGYTVYVCDECGEHKNVYTDKPLGHDWVLKEHEDASCEDGGYDLYECSRDHDHVHIDIIWPLGHDYEITVVYPTATEGGYTIHHCNNCQDEYIDSYTDPLGANMVLTDTIEPKCCEVGYYVYQEVGNPTNERRVEIPALGHSFEWVWDIEADCENWGIRHQVCTKCEEEGELELVPNFEHDYTETVYDATCTEGGYILHHCENEGCGHEYKEYTSEALGHDYVFVPGKSATWTENGWESYIYCTRCDFTTYKEISALNHDWGEPTYTWNDGVCTATRVDNNDTSSKEIETVQGTYIKDIDATCTTNEFGHFEVSFTNSAFENQVTEVGSYEKPNSAIQHKWSMVGYSWNGDQCTATRVCTNDTSHKEKETVTGVYVKDTNATCTTNEFGHYEASFVNSAFIKQSTAKNSVEKEETLLNHKYTFSKIEWTGYTATALYVCGNDHSHKENRTCEITSEVTTNPTCTDKGVRTYTATYDGHTSTKTEEIPALQHNYEFDSIVWTGYTAQAKLVCQNNSTHVKYEDATVTDEVTKVATCAATGVRTYTATYLTHSDAKDEVLAIDSNNHDLEHHNAKAPTCTEIGWEAYDTCSRCSYTTYVEKPALQHNYEFDSFVWTEYTAQAKLVCKNDSTHVKYEDATVTNEVTKVATCADTGIRTYTATYLTHTDTKDEVLAIDSNNHDLEHHNAKAPTCTEIGWEAYDTCSRCSYTTYVEKPALQHDYKYSEIVWTGYAAKAIYVCSHDSSHTEQHDCDVTNKVTTEPLCEHKGVRTYTATYDGHTSTKTEEIPALQHDYKFDSFVWTGYTAQAKLVCQNESTHVKYEDATVTNEITTSATCSATGIRTYTATYLGETDNKEEILAIDPNKHIANVGYMLISSNSELENITKFVLIANKDSSPLLGTTIDNVPGNSKMAVVDAILSKDTKSLTSTPSTIYELEKQSDNTYKIKVNGIYVITSTNDLLTDGSKTAVSNYTISFNDSEIIITPVGYNSTWKYRAEKNVIRCYADNKKNSPIYMYGYVGKTEAVEPTCFEDGHNSYYECKYCGKYFSDLECTNEIKDITLGYKAHLSDDDLVHAHIAHCYDDKPYNVAAHYYCETCKKYFDENKVATTLESLSSLVAHNYHKHPQVNATKDSEGKKEYYTCDNEGCTMIFVKIGDEYVVTNEADLIIPKLTHTHAVGEKQDAVSATCTTPGSIEYYKCTDPDCECYLDENGIVIADIVVPSLNHSSMETINAKESSCTEQGNNKYYYCPDCELYFKDDKGVTETTISAELLELSKHKYLSSWDLATSTTTFEIGDKILIIGKSGTKYYSFGSANENNYKAVEIDINNLSNLDSLPEMILGQGTVDGSFSISYLGKVLYAASSKSNYLKSQNSTTANASWIFTINKDGTYNIVAQGTNTRNTIKYNSGSTLFSCYSSDQISPYIYVYSSSVIKETESTCTTQGNYAYYQCEECDNYIVNKEGEWINIGSDLTQVIKDYKHNYKMSYYLSDSCSDVVNGSIVVFTALTGNLIMNDDLTCNSVTKENTDLRLSYEGNSINGVRFIVSIENGKYKFTYVNGTTTKYLRLTDSNNLSLATTATNNLWDVSFSNSGIVCISQTIGDEIYQLKINGSSQTTRKFASYLQDNDEDTFDGNNIAMYVESTVFEAIEKTCETDGRLEHKYCLDCNTYFFGDNQSSTDANSIVTVHEGHHFDSASIINSVEGLEGKTVIIAAKNYTRALSLKIQSTPFRGSSFLKMNDSYIYDFKSALRLVVVKSGDGYVFKTQGTDSIKYLSLNSEHQLEMIDEQNTTCVWSVEITNGVATIKQTIESTDYKVLYSGASNNYMFATTGTLQVALFDVSLNNTYSAHEATCEEEGNIEFKYCYECAKYFNANNEIICDGDQFDTEILIDGHVYGDKVSAVAATGCTNGHEAYYQCTECNKYFNENKEEKTLSELTTNAPNHTDESMKQVVKVGDDALYYYCDTCKKYYTKSNGVYYETTIDQIKSNIVLFNSMYFEKQTTKASDWMETGTQIIITNSSATFAVDCENPTGNAVNTVDANNKYINSVDSISIYTVKKVSETKDDATTYYYYLSKGSNMLFAGDTNNFGKSTKESTNTKLSISLKGGLFRINNNTKTNRYFIYDETAKVFTSVTTSTNCLLIYKSITNTIDTTTAGVTTLTGYRVDTKSKVQFTIDNALYSLLTATE